MKVRLVQHDPIPGQDGYFIFSPTGDYDSFDFVEAYTDDPNVSKGAFQAQYAKFGPIVYRDDEYAELLKQLDVIKEEQPMNELISQNLSIVAEPTEANPASAQDAGDPAPYTVLGS